ncbi:nucleotidyltransferase domain-containing protein [Chromatocurvus halotolerans]|uniref:Putative nucleotidyltransferase-like protein n=1 Tax=Chromatocurvus halotolerans TaxID=1132028 RepID=A0A4R2KPZ0_9GAMM|nr:nucleotidyltransferase family protein [Chromatocurvus halotolerans]TCO76311.1 putative nucleotidyltransferase-like protein [Chromatocurvus halotolerans]
MTTLIDALNDPQSVMHLRPLQLSALMSQARQAGLLAALRVHLDRAGVLAPLPADVTRHLDSASLAQTKQARDLRFEVRCLRDALAPAGLSPILLKGAAYIIGELPAGDGRIISDIDLLTPHAAIPAAESALIAAGWITGPLDDYDEQYYRRWMHEIPPMAHKSRGSVVDLHHTILPPTAAPHVDAGRLFESLKSTSLEGVLALGNCDQVIHSATHLFHESEFHHALRDLWDLNQLLRDFETSVVSAHGAVAGAEGGASVNGAADRVDQGGAGGDFWSMLEERACALDLGTPTYLALRYASRLFGTPVPADTLNALRPPLARARSLLWDPLFLRGAFSLDYPGDRPRGRAFALWLLYLRGHVLRMPLRLLVPHLVRKAVRRGAVGKGSENVA